MGSRYLSAATVIQLAVVTAALALCLSLLSAIHEHEQRLREVYGDQVFSLRAVVTESGVPFRFDQHDVGFIQDALHSDGIAVAGLGLSYIDAREVDPVPEGASARGHQLRTRIALADVTPLYFEILGISDQSDVYLYRDDAYPCIVSQDLAIGLFGDVSPEGHSVMVSGGKQLVVVGEVRSDHLLPVVDEPTAAGLVHRPGRFVIYRPLSDPNASASFEHLLFRIEGDVSLMDAMKSVSRFLITHYPHLQFDVYSEYERFAEQSRSARSILILIASAVIIGFVAAGVSLHAEMHHRINTSPREIAIRAMTGAAPAAVAGLVFRSALSRGFLTGLIGCALYGLVSLAGVPLPALPAEYTGARLLPAVISMAAAVIAAVVAALGPTRRAFTIDPSAGLDIESVAGM